MNKIFHIKFSRSLASIPLFAILGVWLISNFSADPSKAVEELQKQTTSTDQEFVPQTSQLQSLTKPQIAAQLRFYAAAIEDARNRLACAQVKVTNEQSIPREFFLIREEESNSAPTKQFPAEEQKSEGQWFLQNGKSAVTASLMGEKLAQTQVYLRIVVDEEKAKLLYHEGVDALPDGTTSVKPTEGLEKEAIGAIMLKNAYSGSIVPREQVLTNGNYKDVYYIDPLSLSFSIEREYIDKTFRALDPSTVSLSEGTLYGSRCVKIVVQNSEIVRFTYILDLEHNYLLRRVRVEPNVGGQYLLYQEIEVPEILESNGVWLPARLEKKLFWAVGAKSMAAETKQPLPALIAQAKAPLKPISNTVTFRDFKAGCDIPPEAFVMEWPEGTTVVNQLTGERFVVKAEAKPDAKAEPNTKAEPGQESDQSPASTEKGK